MKYGTTVDGIFDLKSVSEDWGKLGKPKLDADGCLILKRSKSE